MAEGKDELKAQALATLQAGRRELGAEAQWIREELSPKRVVQRLTYRHPAMMMLGALAVGIALPVLLLRKRGGAPNAVELPGSSTDSSHSLWGRQKQSAPVKAVPPKVGAGAYLSGLLMKAAVPLLIRELYKQRPGSPVPEGRTPLDGSESTGSEDPGQAAASAMT